MSQYLAKLRADQRTWQYGRVDVAHVLPTTQNRWRCTTERAAQKIAHHNRNDRVWRQCEQHTSSSHTRGSSADATPTPTACRRVQVQRARPRPYPSLRQRKESLAAQSPTTHGTGFESPTKQTLNRFKSLKSKLINVTKTLQRGAQVSSRPIPKLSDRNRF